MHSRVAPPLRVEHRRGGLLETVHPFTAALSDGERILWETGPDLSCFWRSGSKPFQLENSLAHLPAEVVASLDDADLAVGTSSHSGESAHVERVSALLARFGLSPEGLRCGSDWPLYDAARVETIRSGGEKCTLTHNCSGKHTFMLAASVHRGWDPDYLPPTHPLQQANLARMRDVCGVEPGIAVDGCGVPCFHVPIRAMARAFARVALAMREEDSVLGRIGRAMWARPELVSGTGRLDLAVTRAATERIACKIGAEALFCVALPERGAAVVIKAHTGNGEALAIGVRAVLDAVAPGLLAPEAWPFAEVRNVAGRLVGERVAVWE